MTAQATNILELTRYVLTKRELWNTYKVDNSISGSTFIDIVTRNGLEITIELRPSGIIEMTFQDEWYYDSGNPDDKSFDDYQKAITYLDRIISAKKVTDFIVSYKDKPQKAFVNLSSIDPNRQMGTERLFEIRIDVNGEERVVAKISEYPIYSFTIYEKDKDVSFQIEDFRNQIYNQKMN